jgi:hypothetical protein
MSTLSWRTDGQKQRSEPGAEGNSHRMPNEFCTSNPAEQWTFRDMVGALAVLSLNCEVQLLSVSELTKCGMTQSQATGCGSQCFPGTLSQVIIRAVRCSSDVTMVLLGVMRHAARRCNVRAAHRTSAQGLHKTFLRSVSRKC